jgi:hypothetical protein
LARLRVGPAVEAAEEVLLTLMVVAEEASGTCATWGFLSCQACAGAADDAALVGQFADGT